MKKYLVTRELLEYEVRQQPVGGTRISCPQVKAANCTNNKCGVKCCPTNMQATQKPLEEERTGQRALPKTEQRGTVVQEPNLSIRPSPTVVIQVNFLFAQPDPGH